MEKNKDVNDTRGVTDYVQKLDTSMAQLIDAIRQVLLSTDSNIGERIKWNSPSFFYSGEMKLFDPKEYKRELIVTNLRQKGYMLLIFPSGDKIIDTTGFLEGDYKDGRRMVKIFDLIDLETKKEQLQNVIRKWLSLIEK